MATIYMWVTNGCNPENLTCGCLMLFALMIVGMAMSANDPLPSPTRDCSRVILRDPGGQNEFVLWALPRGHELVQKLCRHLLRWEVLNLGASGSRGWVSEGPCGSALGGGVLCDTCTDYRRCDAGARALGQRPKDDSKGPPSPAQTRVRAARAGEIAPRDRRVVQPVAHMDCDHVDRAVRSRSPERVWDVVDLFRHQQPHGTEAIERSDDPGLGANSTTFK